ncbi:MAG: DUF3102 domain-containing protein [Pseudohongiella nitratireducens]|nr:DUF3102 domain-containing protein [Pseudohongiella nitratireducens]MDF1622501.1 DUF3102 domain-containing protein [Pseudohongiella nitratireducens]
MAAKAGRKKETTAVEKIGPDYVENTPDDIQQEEESWRKNTIQQDKTLAEIDKNFGNNLPYDKTRVEGECQFFLRESATAMLEAGSRLILLKEHEGHGEFQSSLDRIGIAPRAAQKMMQAAVKFSNKPAIAALGRGKMFELMVEDDDQLEALQDGGTVAGLKLDDIEKMSVREVKAALRQERERRKQESEANERLLESKDQKLNDLERKLDERQRRVKSWEGIVNELSINLTTMSGGVMMNIDHLRAQIDEILKEAENYDLSEAEMAAIVSPFSDHIQSLWMNLRELQAEFDQNLSGYLPVFVGDAVTAEIEG